MQLGYTIPLQKYLKVARLMEGSPVDLRFCWDLHLLSPGGIPSLFCVHASSRYAFLLYNLTNADWQQVPTLFEQELYRVLSDEGLGNGCVERYFSLAGTACITKTHGRRPVAFLNRAVDDLYALPVGMDTHRMEQPQVRLSLNNMSCRSAGHDGVGTARTFLERDLQQLRQI